MIYLQNLKKRFGPKVLFDDINFHLRPRECVGLVGENGMGKTTLLRVILKKESLDGGDVVVRKGARMAMLEQELHTGDESVLERVVKGDSHYQEVVQAIERLQNDRDFHDRSPEAWSRQYGDWQHEFERLGGYEREARAKKILQGLGFKEGQWDRSLQELSGGWRMRAELARLLLQSPDVLLLDEPTNHLDLHSVIWLESFLRNYDGSVLLISHDRRFLNTLVSRIAELDRGKLTAYTGDYETFERLKEERIAQLEAQAANQNRRIAQLERFVERFRAKNTKASQAKSKQKQLDKMDRVETHTDSKSVKFRFPQPVRTGRMVAELTDVCKSYGPVEVYRDFSIAVERGWKIALVGENGAGKSTLLKLLAGQLAHDDGELKLGVNVTRAYYAQHHAEVLNAGHTVYEALDEVAPQLSRTHKQSILGAFLFSGDDVNKKVSVLSGGERSRLSLGRMLASPATFLLLDEPTNHLDMRSCEMLAAALADYEGTVVTISHDRFFLDGIITRVWEVDGGRVKQYPGNYSEYEWAKSRETPAAETVQGEKPARESSAQQRKAQKRQEAEARNRRYRQLKPLETRLKQVESRLEEVLEEKQEVETQLADAGLYQDDNKQALMDTLDRQKAIAKEETDLMWEWDDLSKKIEKISG